MRHVIGDGDRVKFADLLTHPASDTSYGTYTHDILSLVQGAALYEMLLLIRHKLNQMPRTCCHTLSAGLARFLVHYRDSVLNMNRVKLDMLPRSLPSPRQPNVHAFGPPFCIMLTMTQSLVPVYL